MPRWREGVLTWALRIRSLHGFPLSPLRQVSAATLCAVAVALCAASMARIVANSRRRVATCLKESREMGRQHCCKRGGESE